MTELLGCPFCGGTDLDVMNPVSCNTCLSSGPMVIAPSLEEVIAIWNKRAAVELNRAWLPIESAPKDGTYVILGCAGSHSEEGRWVGDSERNHWGETGWFATDDDVFYTHPSNPTHYMKLPASPEHGED